MQELVMMVVILINILVIIIISFDRVANQLISIQLTQGDPLFTTSE